MELIASLFCHVPEGLPETEVQQELQRQHDMLAQHAAHTGRAIEHCFFMWVSSTLKNRMRFCFAFCNARRLMISDLFL